MDKSAIRREMRERRRALSPAEKARAAEAICRSIAARIDSGSIRGPVAVYLAAPDEIDLSAAIETMLARGVTVVAPRWNGAAYELAKLEGLSSEDLRTGPMGIREPRAANLVCPQEIRFWLVPGLAFTRSGDRLGYGGGWYDRFLADAAPDAFKLGVAYGFQIVRMLPCDPHDIRLDGLVADVPL